VLLLCDHSHTLLHADPGGVVLVVEQLLCILGQRSHPGMEVRVLKVGHSPKALLPYGVLLILNREKRDTQCCCSGEAALTQVSKSGVCRHLDDGVGLTVDDGP
jgi:hypothetical protein